MALIGKAELLYAGQYSWTAIPGDNPKVTGEPDSTRFSRHEGYEVLYLINKLAELWNLKQKASANKMERMIKSGLPATTQTQEDVRAWIHANWDKYK